MVPWNSSSSAPTTRSTAAGRTGSGALGARGSLYRRRVEEESRRRVRVRSPKFDTATRQSSLTLPPSGAEALRASPFLFLYAPECAEGEFSEVRMQNPE